MGTLTFFSVISFWIILAIVAVFFTASGLLRYFDADLRHDIRRRRGK